MQGVYVGKYTVQLYEDATGIMLMHKQSVPGHFLWPGCKAKYVPTCLPVAELSKYGMYTYDSLITS